MIRKLVMSVLLSLGVVMSAMASEPQDMLEKVSDQMISELVANRDKVKQDPQYIINVINMLLVPHFDFDEMSKRVLAVQWRSATDDQKQRFEKEFTQLVVRTYATAFRSYSDEKVQFVSQRTAEGDPNRVEVKCLIKQTNGQQPIPVNYRLINKNNIWKVYDLTVDNVSLISNFRDQFSASINNQGLDAVIADIAKRNQEKLEKK